LVVDDTGGSVHQSQAPALRYRAWSATAGAASRDYQFTADTSGSPKSTVTSRPDKRQRNPGVSVLGDWTGYSRSMRSDLLVTTPGHTTRYVFVTEELTMKP
jgi:hypothetical protein